MKTFATIAFAVICFAAVAASATPMANFGSIAEAADSVANTEEYTSPERCGPFCK